METPASARASLSPFLARIRSEDGKKAYGAGFLISPDEVLTCAHVVADALKLPRDVPEMPSAKVHLDFPLLTPALPVAARVTQWRGWSGQNEIDVAVLKLLEEPHESLYPAPCIVESHLRGHPFTVFGFPEGHDKGVYAYGTIKDRRFIDWQIEADGSTGYPVLQGFSGSPVWDDNLQSVIGMIHEVERNKEAKAAFVLSVETLRESGAPIEPITNPASALIDRYRIHLEEKVGRVRLFGVTSPRKTRPF